MRSWRSGPRRKRGVDNPAAEPPAVRLVVKTANTNPKGRKTSRPDAPFLDCRRLRRSIRKLERKVRNRGVWRHESEALTFWRRVLGAHGGKRRSSFVEGCDGACPLCQKSDEATCAPIPPPKPPLIVEPARRTVQVCRRCGYVGPQGSHPTDGTCRRDAAPAYQSPGGLVRPSRTCMVCSVRYIRDDGHTCTGPKPRGRGKKRG